MNDEQFVKFQSVINTACEKHLAADGEIVFGAFHWTELGTTSDCRCPVGCVVSKEEIAAMTTSTSLIDKFHLGLNKALGFNISQFDLLAFTGGFDGLKDFGGDAKAYKFGQELRVKYIKEDVEQAPPINLSPPSIIAQENFQRWQVMAEKDAKVEENIAPAPVSVSPTIEEVIAIVEDKVEAVAEAVSVLVENRERVKKLEGELVEEVISAIEEEKNE